MQTVKIIYRQVAERNGKGGFIQHGDIAVHCTVPPQFIRGAYVDGMQVEPDEVYTAADVTIDGVTQKKDGFFKDVPQKQWHKFFTRSEVQLAAWQQAYPNAD